MPVSIKIKDLSKRIGGNVALGGVTADFDEGMIHGLIGSEGAGKTTLLRMLVKLLSPEKGSIAYYLDGKEVPLGEIRESISYMPGRQSLYGDLSVDEHLEFFRGLYGIPRKIYETRRKELLHISRLENFTERRASKLSGGMYKKLGLICALLQSPRVLLLDEPTNGVDPISRREFWSLLYTLAEQNILIVIATAYMDEAERCGSVHLMEKGKMIAQGDPRSLLEKEGVESFDRFFIERGEKNL